MILLALLGVTGIAWLYLLTMGQGMSDMAMDDMPDMAMPMAPAGIAELLSLFLMWDLWSLSQVQVEAILRGVEEVAVEAAADPRAPTGIAPGRVLECRM